MEKPKMEQKEKGGKEFSALCGLGRVSVNLKSFSGKFSQLKYPNKIKESNDDALKPIHPQYG
jgi:hypothetical protein